MADFESERTAHLEREVVAAAMVWFEKYTHHAHGNETARSSRFRLSNACRALDDHHKAMAAKEEGARKT